MLARLIAATLFVLAAAAAPRAHAQTEGERARMVVELFTSQGCVQCPRANRLLGMFSREDHVLALTFPVGIWDYLGWRDTLAQPEFADRQRSYSRALRVRGRFTPQLVINGRRQISASDWDNARATYDQQAAQGWPNPAPEVTISRIRGDRVRVTVSGRSSTTPADIWLISYEPGPVTVTVRGGANLNRNIAHYNLVLRIDRLDTWTGRSVWYERSRCEPECAVMVQAPEGGPILAAAFTSRPRH